MRRIIMTALAALLMAFTMAAQTESVPAQGAALDSTLVGKNIFTLLPNITVHQSDNIRKALNNQIASNSSRKVEGQDFQ